MMRHPETLDHEQLVDIVKRVQERLWVEDNKTIRDRINPDKEWTSTAIMDVAQVLEDYDLRPDSRGPLPADDDEGRCPHGMFYTGAGACPACRE